MYNINYLEIKKIKKLKNNVKAVQKVYSFF